LNEEDESGANALLQPFELPSPCQQILYRHLMQGRVVLLVDILVMRGMWWRQGGGGCVVEATCNKGVVVVWWRPPARPLVEEDMAVIWFWV
jgi:hypothetical protein